MSRVLLSLLLLFLAAVLAQINVNPSPQLDREFYRGVVKSTSFCGEAFQKVMCGRDTADGHAFVEDLRDATETVMEKLIEEAVKDETYASLTLIFNALNGENKETTTKDQILSAKLHAEFDLPKNVAELEDAALAELTARMIVNGVFPRYVKFLEKNSAVEIDKYILEPEEIQEYTKFDQLSDFAKAVVNHLYDLIFPNVVNKWKIASIHLDKEFNDLLGIAKHQLPDALYAAGTAVKDGFGEIIVTSKSQSFAYQVLRKHPLALRYSNVFFDQILTRQRTENRDIELVFEGVKTATLKKLADPKSVNLKLSLSYHKDFHKIAADWDQKIRKQFTTDKQMSPIEVLYAINKARIIAENSQKYYDFDALDRAIHPPSAAVYGATFRGQDIIVYPNQLLNEGLVPGDDNMYATFGVAIARAIIESLIAHGILNENYVSECYEQHAKRFCWTLKGVGSNDTFEMCQFDVTRSVMLESEALRLAYAALDLVKTDEHSPQGFFSQYAVYHCSASTLQNDIDRMLEKKIWPSIETTLVLGQSPEFQSMYNCQTTSFAVPEECMCDLFSDAPHKSTNLCKNPITL